MVKPVMAPGVAGGVVMILTTNEFTALVPQPLLAVTLTLPGLVPKLKVAEVVPCPAVTMPPVGVLHVYEVAPATAAIV